MRLQHSISEKRARAVSVLALAVILAMSGCRSARDHLDALEQIHDENYSLVDKISVRSPFGRSMASLMTLLTNKAPSDPSPTRIKNPGMFCQRKILALSYEQPRSVVEYSRALSLLQPVSALGENPLSRTYALDLMGFLWGKYHDDTVPPASGERTSEEAEAALAELPERLEAYRARPGDSALAAACEEAFEIVSDVEYTSWRDTASVLRLFGTLGRSSDYRRLVPAMERGIHRVAPIALRLSLVSALSVRETEFVREEAVEGLGILGDPLSLPHVNRVLVSDRSDAVRRRAAEALGRIGSPISMPSLIEALELDEDPGVRWHARRALAVIVEEDLGPDPDPWRKWWRSQRADEAARADQGS